MTNAAAIGTVQELMDRQGMSNAELARIAKVDPGTIGDFLRGERWPLPGTRIAIEAALGMEVGTIAKIAREGSVSDGSESVLLDLPESALDGLTDAERAEVTATARAAALERARKIRADH